MEVVNFMPKHHEIEIHLVNGNVQADKVEDPASRRYRPLFESRRKGPRLFPVRVAL